MADRDTCCLERCASCSGEFCRVPFPSYVSENDHKHIRVVIETWLREQNVLSQQRMREIHAQPLTEIEWQSMQSTPGHYWPNLYAWRMEDQELKVVEKHLPSTVVVDEKTGELVASQTYKRFLKASRTWLTVSEMMFYHNNGRFPNIEEQYDLLKSSVGPRNRAFFVLADGVAGLRVEYDWLDRVMGEYHRLKAEAEHTSIEKERGIRILYPQVGLANSMQAVSA